MVKIGRGPDGDQLQWKLSQVVYAIASIVFITIGFNGYEEHVINAIRIADPARLAVVSIRILMAEPLLYLALLVVVLSFFRPVKALFRWGVIEMPNDLLFYKKLMIGITVGSIVSLVCSPIPLGPRNTGVALIISEVSDATSSYIEIPLAIILIGCIAICTELFFRGVVLRTFAKFSSMPSSIIGCALVGASVYPDHRPYVGFIVGVMSSVLFWKTDSLTAPIIASIVFSLTERLCAAAYHHVV